MNAVKRRSPRSCFVVYDLYSTHFGESVNDDVERLLFGPIDDRGSSAVRAFIEGDEREMHDAFRNFFEYVDAQRLRTPKGLDWIKKRYSGLDQLRLMREMQQIRLMHTTMWMEGVREIVSAEDSDVKFLISDCPVTFYNAASPPSADESVYPEDPPCEWIGTITLFPLDANTCIIFSHLEYAEHPQRTDLRTARTNARYRGNGLARTDAFIRNRCLTREDVIRINHILKCRARRYIGASKKEWLYPEQMVSGSWEVLASTLLPKDHLWKFGGEIVVGYEDGSSRYQDAFGRGSKAHEHLKHDGPMPTPGPDEACGCNSGRVFSLCCMDVPVVERPSWTVMSIRQRNLTLCRALAGILGLSDGKSWVDVRRQISDDEVVRIYELFEALWPPETDLLELAPRPSDEVSRTVYLGTADPRTVEATVLGWLEYFDEIVVAHPFMNPGRMRPEFSPTKSPSQHKAQTIRNALFMFMLEPYMDAGLVHVIPDPGDFNLEFGATAMRLSQARAAGLKLEEGDFGLMEAMTEDEHRRLSWNLPDDALRRLLRKKDPNVSAALLDEVIAHIRARAEEDPFALLQPLSAGDGGGQLLQVKGYNLESALYVASLTGSTIHTDARAHWNQLRQHAVQPGSVEAWPRTAAALLRTSFKVEMQRDARDNAIDEGRLEPAKSVFRLLAQRLRAGASPELDSETAREVGDAAGEVEAIWSRVASQAALPVRVHLSATQGGFHRDEVERLLLTFGRARNVHPVPFALLIDFGAARLTVVNDE